MLARQGLRPSEFAHWQTMRDRWQATSSMSAETQCYEFATTESTFTLAARLKLWFATLPRSLTIACDSFADLALLLDALNNKYPPNLIRGHDLRGHIDLPMFHRAVVEYHERHGVWYHVWHDARAHRHRGLPRQDSRKGTKK